MYRYPHEFWTLVLEIAKSQKKNKRPMASPLLRAWNLQLESSVECLACVYYLQTLCLLVYLLLPFLFTFLYLALKCH